MEKSTVILSENCDVNTDVPVLYRQNNSTIYVNGAYKVEDLYCDMKGSIYEYNDIVSAQFNQLKGKIFNLIEASITDKQQCEAVKGLIKGFCNDNYKNTVGDLGGLFTRLGFSDLSVPLSAEPLENRDR